MPSAVTAGARHVAVEVFDDPTADAAVAGVEAMLVVRAVVTHAAPRGPGLRYHGLDQPWHAQTMRASNINVAVMQ